MRITVGQLRQVIKEEVRRARLGEASPRGMPGTVKGQSRQGPLPPKEPRHMTSEFPWSRAKFSPLTQNLVDEKCPPDALDQVNDLMDLAGLPTYPAGTTLGEIGKVSGERDPDKYFKLEFVTNPDGSEQFYLLPNHREEWEHADFGTGFPVDLHKIGRYKQIGGAIDPAGRW